MPPDALIDFNRGARHHQRGSHDQAARVCECDGDNDGEKKDFAEGRLHGFIVAFSHVIVNVPQDHASTATERRN